MLKTTIVGLLLLTTAMLACGGVADSPETVNLPSSTITSVQQEGIPVPQETTAETSTGPTALLATTDQSEAPPAASPQAEPTQAINADGRAEGLVAEWEKDLTPIKQVSDCVEQELGKL